MPSVSPSIIQAAADIDPLKLAILFIGLISLGVIWVAVILARGHAGSRKQ